MINLKKVAVAQGLLFGAIFSKAKKGIFNNLRNSWSPFLREKKAISPVVSTSLLLVVAVVGVVGFNTWFNSYSASLFVDTELKSNSASYSVGVEDLIGENLYLRLGGSNLSVNKVEINGIDCNVTSGGYSGIESFNVSSCLSNLTTSAPEIVIFTDNGVFSEYSFIEDFTSSSTSSSFSLDCSNLSGGTWVGVEGNSAFNTSDFCVMKYEPRNNGFANSTPVGLPWRSITQSSARTQCTSLGANYHLITNNEWMTIARNLESNSNNWVSGLVGSGEMFTGHTDNSPNSVLNSSWSDLDSYLGTGDNSTLNPEQRRTMYLSTGDIIWDFAGNGREILNDTWTSFPATDLGISSSTWTEWESVTNFSYLKPLGSYNSTNKIGKVMGSGSNRVYIRGGRYYSRTYGGGADGIYYLGLDDSTGSCSCTTFRCVYAP